MTHTPGLSVCKYVCWNKKQKGWMQFKKSFFPSSEMLNIRSHYAWLDTISKVTPLHSRRHINILKNHLSSIGYFLPSIRLHISTLSIDFFNRLWTRSIIIHCFYFKIFQFPIEMSLGFFIKFTQNFLRIHFKQVFVVAKVAIRKKFNLLFVSCFFCKS